MPAGISPVSHFAVERAISKPPSFPTQRSTAQSPECLSANGQGQLDGWYRHTTTMPSAQTLRTKARPHRNEHEHLDPAKIKHPNTGNEYRSISSSHVSFTNMWPEACSVPEMRLCAASLRDGMLGSG